MKNSYVQSFSFISYTDTETLINEKVFKGRDFVGKIFQFIGFCPHSCLTNENNDELITIVISSYLVHQKHFMHMYQNSFRT